MDLRKEHHDDVFKALSTAVYLKEDVHHMGFVIKEK